MRVKIEHAEIRVGWPFPRPRHEVYLTIHFTHEEKQIIRQRGLLEHHVIDRVPVDAQPDDDPDWYALKVGHLFERKPDKFRLKTPSDAKLYAAQLRDAMHCLKAWLDENAELGTPLVFEV